MRKALFALALAAVVAGCASKQTASSTDVKKELETKWEKRVGSATKSDFVEDFGDPEWCRPSEDTGTETCRFYKKKGTKWMGEKTDRKHYEAFDEIVADFDSKGVLRSFKANAQR